MRTANSGISSFITPHGDVISSLPPLVKGNLTEEVKFISDTTLYTRVGDVVICPIVLALIIIGIVTIIKLPIIQRKFNRLYISSDRSDN